MSGIQSQTCLLKKLSSIEANVTEAHQHNCFPSNSGCNTMLRTKILIVEEKSSCVVETKALDIVREQ